MTKSLNGCIITTMKTTTTKLWTETKRKLKMIAAMTDELMVEVMDRLATQELERLRKENHDETDSSTGQSR